MYSSLQHTQGVTEAGALQLMRPVHSHNAHTSADVYARCERICICVCIVLCGYIYTSLRCFSGIFSRLLRLGPLRAGTAAAPSVVPAAVAPVVLLSVVVAVAVSPSAVSRAGSFCGAAASAYRD
jgi:hypothetical protein